MINFTVGPVQSPDEVRQIGSFNVPYFRTSEFSEVVLESEALMNKFVNAPSGSRTLFVTASGSGGMEAVVMNELSYDDKALVINGGSFGTRFEQLLDLHNIEHTTIKLEQGAPLTYEDLKPYEDQGYTAFLVNIHETSTGILYDKELIRDFCGRNGLFLVVDAISSFLADPLDMQALGADVIVTGSQKALACAPGICVVVLSPDAVKRAYNNTCVSMYFDFESMLENGKRGQTPFTPAVGTILQIHARLLDIDKNGGVEAQIAHTKALAEDFRSRVAGLPLSLRLVSPSNACTYVECKEGSAPVIFEKLKDEYGMWVCPNGGANKEHSFRVGHIGNLTLTDNMELVAALKDLAHEDIY